jgi:sulfite exporter TauE/SafE
MTPLTAFLTGITTGGLTCLAVQGGLLAALLAKQHTADEEQVPRWQRVLLPVSGFLLAKIVIYSVLGVVLGFVGQKISLSTTMQAWLQGVAAVFMVVTGIRILRPQWLPWLMIPTPVKIRRYIRQSAKSELLVAPAILGTLTIFIPCGTTLAIETASLASGNPLSGASILFFFVLGTAPMFFLVGVLAKGSTMLQRRLQYVAVLLIIGTGLYSFDSALNLVDAPISFRNIVAGVQRNSKPDTRTDDLVATTSPVIMISYNGYAPNEITVPAGQPVTLKLNSADSLSCTNIFLIPKLGIQRQLVPSSSLSLGITFPKKGNYSFTCGMGMFTGTIRAI